MKVAQTNTRKESFVNQETKTGTETQSGSPGPEGDKRAAS